jgi:hypothetical protein
MTSAPEGARMTDQLLAPTFLFRFSVPLFYRKELWSAGGAALGEDYRLPSFGELEDRPMYADVRGAWSEQGLAFSVRVEGKKQAPWCRSSRLEDSDGLHLWIDTRDTHNIHRASRFCHRFALLPVGGGRRLTDPVAEQMLINRARENPKPVPVGMLKIRSEKRVDGYLLEGHIPAAALTGYDPGAHQRLGFTYAVMDRELGWQTFTVGSEFPFDEDPSLWGTLELVGE